MSIAKGSIHDDFFEQNPELTILPEVKKLLDSKNKDASKIMWSIYLMEDPESTFYRIPREERIEEIKREYFDINLEDYPELVREYSRFILTKEQWMLKEYYDGMEELVLRLKDQATSIDDRLKILSQVPKVWDGLEKIKKQIKEEGSKTQIRGNAKEGAREKRERLSKKDKNENKDLYN